MRRRTIAFLKCLGQFGQCMTLVSQNVLSGSIPLGLEIIVLTQMSLQSLDVASRGAISSLSQIL